MCTRFYIEQEDPHIQSTIKAVQHSSLTVLMQKQLEKNTTINRNAVRECWSTAV